MHNPSDASEAYMLQAELLVDILSTQKSLFESGVSEYALIDLLKKAPYYFFDEDALREPLMLFKTHFILFHALYQLKMNWIQGNEGVLDIHTLNIKLNQCKGNDAQQLRIDEGGELTEADPLAEYYLDWGNFEKADRKSVDALLNAFWQRMVGGKVTVFNEADIEQAHIRLGLPQNEHVSLSVLKRVYKKALQVVHPDKGGTQKEAQEVIHAYQLLLGFYSFK